jgi:catechol 2,3-dioxygenase-like lactoylglutathione lyase family enzyme
MKGISHITLMCKDIIRSAQLFCDLFDAQEIYSSDEHNFSLSKEKFLLIGDLWIALMQGNPIERSYNHIAFHIDEDELTSYEAKIQKYGLDILPSRPRDEREGKSIYFYDYDNHLFELHTGTLENRLQFYKEKLQK